MVYYNHDNEMSYHNTPTTQMEEKTIMAKTTKTATTNNTTAKENNMKKVATKKVDTKNEVATVETKKVDTKKVSGITEVKVKKVNASKIDLSMTDFEAMLKEANIQFKPNNCEYRILKSNTAIHILKSKIYINCTNEDFKSISDKVKTADMKLQPEGNKIDKKRPDRVEFTTVETLKAVIKAIASNNAIATA